MTHVVLRAPLGKPCTQGDFICRVFDNADFAKGVADGLNAQHDGFMYWSAPALDLKQSPETGNLPN